MLHCSKPRDALVILTPAPDLGDFDGGILPMSAEFSKHQLVGVMPHSVSVAGVPGEHPSSGRSIGRVFAWLRGIGARNATLNELNSFSARELADIGLSRADIHRVFEPSFAAEYARRR